MNVCRGTVRADVGLQTYQRSRLTSSSNPKWQRYALSKWAIKQVNRIICLSSGVSFGFLFSLPYVTNSTHLNSESREQLPLESSCHTPGRSSQVGRILSGIISLQGQALWHAIGLRAATLLLAEVSKLEESSAVSFLFG